MGGMDMDMNMDKMSQMENDEFFYLHEEPSESSSLAIQFQSDENVDSCTDDSFQMQMPFDTFDPLDPILSETLSTLQDLDIPECPQTIKASIINDNQNDNQDNHNFDLEYFSNFNNEQQQQIKSPNSLKFPEESIISPKFFTPRNKNSKIKSFHDRCKSVNNILQSSPISSSSTTTFKKNHNRLRSGLNLNTSVINNNEFDEPSPMVQKRKCSDNIKDFIQLDEDENDIENLNTTSSNDIDLSKSFKFPISPSQTTTQVNNIQFEAQLLQPQSQSNTNEVINNYDPIYLSKLSRYANGDINYNEPVTYPAVLELNESPLPLQLDENENERFISSKNIIKSSSPSHSKSPLKLKLNSTFSPSPLNSHLKFHSISSSPLKLNLNLDLTKNNNNNNNKNNNNNNNNNNNMDIDIDNNKFQRTAEEYDNGNNLNNNNNFNLNLNFNDLFFDDINSNNNSLSSSPLKFQSQSNSQLQSQTNSISQLNLQLSPGQDNNLFTIPASPFDINLRGRKNSRLSTKQNLSYSPSKNHSQSISNSNFIQLPCQTPRQSNQFDLSSPEYSSPELQPIFFTPTQNSFSVSHFQQQQQQQQHGQHGLINDGPDLRPDSPLIAPIAANFHHSPNHNHSPSIVSTDSSPTSSICKNGNKKFRLHSNHNGLTSTIKLEPPTLNNGNQSSNGSISPSSSINIILSSPTISCSSPNISPNQRIRNEGIDFNNLNNLRSNSTSPLKRRFKHTARNYIKKSTLPPGCIDSYIIGPDENNEYICLFENCNKVFKRRYNIRSHVQTHLCDRPFICKQCGSRFVRQHDLKRHETIHEDYKFQCACEKKFARHDALMRHQVRNICIGGIEVPGVTKKKGKRGRPRKYPINDQKDNNNVNDDSNDNSNSESPEKSNKLDPIIDGNETEVESDTEDNDISDNIMNDEEIQMSKIEQQIQLLSQQH